MHDLNDDNFMIYAIKAYNKPVCIMSEFEEDIKRIKYVKRLIKKYLDKGDLRERLILNHIIILSNTFGTEATVRMLFYKLTSNYYPVIKTCLLFLNYMPKVVYGINGKDLNSSDITIDMELGKRLRNI
jgi:hypothetical protein